MPRENSLPFSFKLENQADIKRDGRYHEEERKKKRSEGNGVRHENRSKLTPREALAVAGTRRFKTKKVTH